MKISTRGRYALRVMVDLAEHGKGGYIPLKDIAVRQEISHKYLENIMIELSRAGIVDGQHGKGGGYQLCKSPEKYTVGEILRITEGELAPVTCLEKSAGVCSHAPDCRTLPMWIEFYDMVNKYFDGVTIADLMRETDGNEYVI